MSSTTPFTERAALDAVMAAERALGRGPVQLPPGHAGYDIESRTADGSLLFIEVKGRARGAQTFTLTRTEIGIGGLPFDAASVSAIGAAVSALAVEPNPSDAFIRGDYRRLRVGAYRIMYVVEDDIITIERVDLVV